MKTRFYILPLLCCLMVWGCQNAEKAKDEFSIQGQVLGLESKVLHLERIQPTRSEPLQDVPLDAEGKFSLKQKGEPNTLFQLRADDGRRMLFLPEFDALEIEGDADELDAYQVRGGEKTKRLRDFRVNIQMWSKAGCIHTVMMPPTHEKSRKVTPKRKRPVIAHWP